MIKFLLGNWIPVALGAVILTILGYGYWLHGAYEDAVAERNAYREQVEGYVRSIEAFTGLQKEYQASAAEAAELEKKLARHDLEELANEKPNLVARRVNAATQQLFSAIEEASQPTE